ncbi:MAG: AI-2E family transporter [Kofleriaceae bacterium]|nr:AI-2E family transporter [Myxococcales bacterium]MCB9564799.1 AI-2E family transporter [Kofleriaceae bacterium]MCB9574127.1 AI-2E family transporter [Kofleriaceae bacterium]
MSKPSPQPSPARPARPPDEQQILTMLRWLLYAVFVVVAWNIVGTLAAVLGPILVAFGIAYLLDPVLERLVARGMSRALGATLLLVLFLGALVGSVIAIAPRVVGEVEHFVADLPRMVDTATKWATANLGVELPEDWAKWLKSEEAKGILEKLAGPAEKLLGAAVGGVFSLLAFLAEMLLVPVFAYYFLLDWPNITERIKKIIPPRRRGKVLGILEEVDGVVSGWVRGQATVTTLLAVLYAVCFSVIGIHLAIPIGLLVGALTVIPFVGTLVGAAITVLVVLLDWQGASPLIAVGGVFLVLHLLEAAVLTPKIVGHKVGLSESAALFAVVAGGKLLGFVGVLLAVPLAATIAVLIRHAVRYYEQSEFFGHEEDALVPVTDAMAVVMPDAAAHGTRPSREMRAQPAPASTPSAGTTPSTPSASSSAGDGDRDGDPPEDA